ncbi:MAG: hypothetical protein METHP_01036 [Methanoregula sp. SKADARSKE-2]|nr:MAG: hypothetical protein METHP_01036 [Methanoregula sp. SKADARSKE-2]
MADPVIPVVPGISENAVVIIIALAILGVFILFLMIRELRLMKTGSRKEEIELEREKLKILQQHATASGYHFTRMSPEQIAGIKCVEDNNATLETTIFSKERLVETRLKRLENYVKIAKLDNMMGKIDQEEKKVK